MNKERPTAVDEFFEEQEFEHLSRQDDKTFFEGLKIIQKKGWFFARFKDYANKVLKAYEIDEERMTELFRQMCKEATTYNQSVKAWLYELKEIWDRESKIV